MDDGRLSQNAGFAVPGVVTGKPLSIGGSAGREEATGRGVAITTREIARRMGLTLAGASVAIQGFGNVGRYAALILSRELGCRVVAVSDARGGFYQPKGLDIEKLAQSGPCTALCRSNGTHNRFPTPICSLWTAIF